MEILFLLHTQHNMHKKVLLLFISIIFIEALLRLWQLGNMPPSPDWDEVALGYNSYSILHTGKDEFGKLFPVVLRSFDDYKPALYAYLAIPTVALFGLTVFAVRLPSVICGILAVIGVFFLVRELFKKDTLALLSSLLLAISPWHIQFSRVAFETNVGLTCNIFAALFFIKGVKKPVFLIFSVLCMVAAIYVYQSEKVFTPLLALALVIIYRKELLRLAKVSIVLPVVIGIVTILPILLFLATNKQALLRAQATSIFQNKTVLLQKNIRRIEYDKQTHDKLGLVFDNRRVVYAQTIIDGYLSHFNFNWFLNGDISRHHAPDMGIIYIFEFPFILIGIYQLVFGNYDKKTKQLIFSWLLLAPVPAAATTGVPHAVRTLNFLPTWQIFSAIGMLTAYIYWQRITYKLVKISVISIIGIFAIANFCYYLNQYFVQQFYANSSEWQYGYVQLIPEVEKIKNSYRKIIVADREPMDNSYMFFAFYLQYPPIAYQAANRNRSGGFAANHTFDKFEFRQFDWNQEPHNLDVLYIGTPKDFPKGIKTMRTINYPDSTSAMMIVRK